MSLTDFLKGLETRETEKIVEEVLYRYYAKYRRPLDFFKVLREALPKKRFGLIDTGYDKKVDIAVKLLGEGMEFEDALYKSGLIGEDSYFLIKNAIATGNLEKVLERKKRAEEIIREKTTKLLTSLISPGIGFVLSFVALYLAIYKLYPQIKSIVDLGDDWFYRVLDWFSVDEMRYFAFVSAVVFLFFVAFLLRRKLPFVKGLFLNIEKLKFFSFLSVGLDSGLNIYHLLERYGGYFKGRVETVISLSRAGEELTDVFVKVFSPYLSPIERANLIAGMQSQERTTMAKTFEDAFKESLRELDKGLAKLSSFSLILTMILVGAIIYLIFVKIYLQIYTVVNSQMGF